MRPVIARKDEPWNCQRFGLYFPSVDSCHSMHLQFGVLVDEASEIGRGDGFRGTFGECDTWTATVVTGECPSATVCAGQVVTRPAVRAITLAASGALRENDTHSAFPQSA